MTRSELTGKLRRLADEAEAGKLDGLPAYLAQALLETLKAVLAWVGEGADCV